MADTPSKPEPAKEAPTATPPPPAKDAPAPKSPAAAGPASAASPEAAPASPPTPAPAPAPASPEAVPQPAHDTGLLPPQHWTNRPIDEYDDGDSALGSDAESSTASITSSILKYRTVNGRTYHSERGNNNYWGANDEAQNATLDIIHHALTLMYDDKMHMAPLPSETAMKVLDLGTGTGIWAVDYADAHPHTEVIGTDISPIQPTWIPPNLRFQIEDYNEDWTFADNTFDFVHQRWLVGTVNDWEKHCREAYRVLKPGGWFETIDCDGAINSDDNSIPKDSAASQWSHIFYEGSKKIGMQASFRVHAEGLQRKGIDSAGFTNVTERTFKMPWSEWADAEKDKNQHEVGMFARVALENDLEGVFSFFCTVLGWDKEEIGVYAAHLRKEMRNPRIHGYVAYHSVWAQKPLTA